MRLPRILSAGFLDAFEVDVPGQQVKLLCWGARIQGIDVRVNLRAVFQRVCYLRVISDLPLTFNDNEIDRLEEKLTSSILDAVEERKGWTYLVTDIDTAILGEPPNPRPAMRHFLVQSTFVTAEWLCTEGSFSLEPTLEPPH
jgi:hypothetical protein